MPVESHIGARENILAGLVLGIFLLKFFNMAYFIFLSDGGPFKCRGTRSNLLPIYPLDGLVSLSAGERQFASRPQTSPHFTPNVGIGYRLTPLKGLASEARKMETAAVDCSEIKQSRQRPLPVILLQL